ncbi:hypothetical protein BN946_scf185043.g41 [Trametes cinnabarina]|uniref:Uncharacterized protein n=1 Tax=Pycnoporus cinnabarinus TaxID=5643 RepID=A0A060SHK5_PYCCI|nr:hypothetical protein BN946_scf185043.g41 [Trametes cinnabarina]
MRDDPVSNITVFIMLLQPHLSSPWQRYLAAHPPPPQDILSRMVLGASKKAGAQKKRTSARAADTIASAFANHLGKLPLSGAIQEIMLLRGFCYLRGPGGEFAEEVIQNRVMGGLFDALDESVECVLADEDGAKALTLIATAIDANLSTVSEKTRAALQTQRHRTGMVWKVFEAGLAKGDNDSRNQYGSNHPAFAQGGMPDARNPL